MSLESIAPQPEHLIGRIGGEVDFSWTGGEGVGVAASNRRAHQVEGYRITNFGVRRKKATITIPERMSGHWTDMMLLPR